LHNKSIEQNITRRAKRKKEGKEKGKRQEEKGD